MNSLCNDFFVSRDANDCIIENDIHVIEKTAHYTGVYGVHSHKMICTNIVITDGVTKKTKRRRHYNTELVCIH